MKKIYLKLGCILLCATLAAACSDKDDPTTPAPPDQGQDPDPDPDDPDEPDEPQPAPVMTVSFSEAARTIGGVKAADYLAANEEYLVEGSNDGNVFALRAQDMNEVPMIMRVIADGKGIIEEFAFNLPDTVEAMPVWQNYLTEADSYGLGGFMGTKFRRATPEGLVGGVLQSPEETVAKSEEFGTEGVEFYPLFSINELTYAVPELLDGTFEFRLMKKYYPVEYGVLGELIGTDLDELLQRYYVIGNKMQLGTALTWGYFPMARDVKGQLFTMNADTDSSQKTIKELSVYVPEDMPSEDAVAVWKDYITNSSDYSLGEFRTVYSTDVFGGKDQEFQSVAEAVAFVEQNGRQKGVIAIYAVSGWYNKLIINKDYVYMLVTAAE